MTTLSLAKANTIIEATLAKGAEMGIKPLSAAVLDAGGHLVAFQRSDRSSFMRFEIAAGKAYGALALGVGSRWLHNQAETRPHFLEGLSNVSGGKIVAVPGGVLIKDGDKIVGAVGVTGGNRVSNRPVFARDQADIAVGAAMRTAGLKGRARDHRWPHEIKEFGKARVVCCNRNGAVQTEIGFGRVLALLGQSP